MEAISSLMECDYVTMENVAGILVLVQRLAASGAKKIGFVGDNYHCGSFGERWAGFTLGLKTFGLQLDEDLCICQPDNSPYNDPDWLISIIQKMPTLPDAFVCANDYLAIHLMSALKKMGLSIPKDIMVTGFDGTSQSALVEPPLTTVAIPGVEIGRIAAGILLNRIVNPDFPFTWTRVKTTPVWRGSIR
jgi:LacI family transcriptional regulator